MTDPERTILITGATSGLGRELARTLSTSPGHLILHGRSAQKVHDLADELENQEGAQASCDTVTGDLSQQADVRRLADEIWEKTDQLSVLVNNAGAARAAQTPVS